MEGRLPGARGVGSPTGGWKPPLLRPTSGGVNSEIHLPPPRGSRREKAATPGVGAPRLH